MLMFSSLFQPVWTSPASELIESSIADNSVMVFSKSYCPYCKRAKKLLSDHKISFKAIELDTTALGSQMQSYLLTKTGQTTVPNIFIQVLCHLTLDGAYWRL